jgi:hypothetical protein
MLSDLVGDKRVVWVSEPRPDTDQATDRLQSDAIALIFAKDETIAALRDQLEAERQAHAEARRLLMADLERIPPQLEAPREAQESPQTVEEEPEGTERAPVEHRRASGGRKRAAAAPVVAQGVREVGRLHIT